MGQRRVIVAADRGFAAVALLTFFSQLGVVFIIRVKAGTHVAFRASGASWARGGFGGKERHHRFVTWPSGESCPQRLWVSKSRARGAKSHWGSGHLVSNRPYAAPTAANEYGHRCGCEEGFRDAPWWRGFAKARLAQLNAWSRMFALFVMA